MGEDPLLWQLLLQLILILVNAIFACAEIAVITINDSKLDRLASAGNKKAARLQSLTSQPSKFLATIQVGITLAGFLGSAFAAENFSGKLAGYFASAGSPIPLETLETVSLIVVTLILSFFTLVLGELVPKRIAMKNAERLALAMSGLIYAISKIFAPLVWLLTKSTNGLLRLLRIDPNTNEEGVTEEEIRMMVDVGSEKGTIDADEKEIINNVFEFDDITAEEVMTHRVDVSILWLQEDAEAWDETINGSDHSRYPICDESKDDVVGVLYAKDYFRLSDRSRENVMKRAVRPAQFVPDSVRADILFRNMRARRNHFAVVLDEYGGMCGVVTINDLLEQLVGNLSDDMTSPAELPDIEAIDSSTWSIRGSTPLDEVARALGVELPIDDYETFSGMVFGLLGTVPADGQTPELEEFGLVIKVTEIREHRVEKATVGLIDKTV